MGDETIDFRITESAAMELDKIADEFGLTRHEVFSKGLTLLRIYMQTIADGSEMCIANDGVVTGRVVVPR